MDSTARQSIVDRLQQANNVLVTVKRNPNVDQLAACIGLTLFLNKLNKHATAVFSGKVPSTIEFLKPEETLEKNTDSLRDFIIALDKSKADKLRYKVEDKVVKIFITPYKTSLSEKDLDFSQGDFNVDVVVALGAQSQTDIDTAITAHGRILHDATVISINNGPGGNLGTLHLEDAQASSLSETLVELCEMLQPDTFDAQMATAFLTGIVAETERYSNTKTSPRTMTISAKLMAAGANQQLIATKLQPSQVASGKIPKSQQDKPAAEDPAGTLSIDHEEEKQEPIELPEVSLPEPVDEAARTPSLAPVAEPASSEPANLISGVKTEVNDDGMQPTPPAPPVSRSRPLAPPTMGGTLTANTQPQNYEPTTDPLTNTQMGQTLQHGKPAVDNNPTLSKIEEEVDSPHLAANTSEPDTSGLDAARRAVEDAATGSTDTITPLKAVGSQPLDLDVQNQYSAPAPTPDVPAAPPQNGATPDFLADKGEPPEQSGNSGTPPTTAPPPVPPPMMPPQAPTAQ